jgi:hypothetical protein
MSTETESFFQTARKLPESEAIFATFASRRQADSFRIGLYKVRKRVEDYTVDISIKDNTVFATKARTVVKYGLVDKNGVVTHESVIAVTNYNKELEEIYQEAKLHNWNESLVDELIANLNDRYGRN